MTLHLLKLIWNQRKANTLIILELFLVFIVLWVCNYQLYVYFQRLNEPLGFDYKHVYKVIISELPDTHPDWREGRNHIEEVYELIDRIRICPGVEHVSISSGAMPFDGYYSGGKLVSDSTVVWLKWGDISPEFIDVFRLKPQNPAVDLKKELVENRILMSPDVWEKLFPEGTQEYVFYLNEDKNETLRTHGITTPVKLSAYHSPYPHAYDFIRKNELIEFGGGNIEVMIRVQPKADKNFPVKFKEQMKGRLAVGNTYVTELGSVEEFKKRYYTVGGDEDNFYQQLFILGFFMVNVFRDYWYFLVTHGSTTRRNRIADCYRFFQVGIERFYDQGGVITVGYYMASGRFRLS
ncbi:MAG: hypothetical protein LUH15_09790 [Tannerellaceae bacterium]|nr:hypothetical protein [Tannerellaceae bacterium]